MLSFADVNSFGHVADGGSDATMPPNIHDPMELDSC